MEDEPLKKDYHGVIDLKMRFIGIFKKIFKIKKIL